LRSARNRDPRFPQRSQLDRPMLLAFALPRWQHKKRGAHVTRLICLALLIWAIGEPEWARAATDQLEEVFQEQVNARQQRKAEELKAREQIEQLKRDRQVNQAQQQLDRMQRQQADPPTGSGPRAAQPQLDQFRNDQELQRLQTDQQINRIQQEKDPLRQQQQINDLERQQQIRSLQEQLQRNQMHEDMERLRHQQQNLR